MRFPSSAWCAVVWLSMMSVTYPVLAQEAADTSSDEDVEQSDEADADDETFIPSEEIEADTEISFPADI